MSGLFRKIKNNFSWKKFLELGTAFVRKRIGLFLFFVFLGAAGYGTFIWYEYVHNPDWSTSRKQEYMRTKDKGTVFNQSRFNEIVSEMNNRDRDYKTDMSDLEDIFRLKK